MQPGGPTRREPPWTWGWGVGRSGSTAIAVRDSTEALSLPKLSIFFPKEIGTCVTHTSGLQEHLLPAVRAPPAAAGALVNGNGFCHSRYSEEAHGTRCSLFYFLLGFLVGQSPFVLFCPGCWRSSLHFLPCINVMRLLCLFDNSVGHGVRCVCFSSFCRLKPNQLDRCFKAHSSFDLRISVLYVQFPMLYDPIALKTKS